MLIQNVKEVLPIIDYRHITEVYGNEMNKASFQEWCTMFGGGWTNFVYRVLESALKHDCSQALEARIEAKMQKGKYHSNLIGHLILRGKCYFTLQINDRLVFFG